MTADDVHASPPSRVRAFDAATLFRTYGTVVVLAALVLSGDALVRRPGTLQDWAEAGLLLVIAFGFDELSRRAARLRIRLSAQLRTDMTSVWAIATAVALPVGVAVTTLVGAFTYDWFRHHRPAGEALHRKVIVLGTILLGAMAASAANNAMLGHVLEPLAGHHSTAWTRTAGVLVAIVTYEVVQRALVTTGLLALGARLRQLVGSRDENLIELATLCLGGLVAVALEYEPFLAVLALAPMITLHRGALVRELETAATIDSKTGLVNAVALEHVGHREVSRAERENSALAVLIVDIDRFKRVNDRFGHLVGDAVLRGVGQALESGLREYDTVGRFGGEEFVALLPTAHEAEALVVAERLRAAVAALHITQFDPRVEDATDDGLSVSIGVACFGTHGVAMTDLLFAADTALYRAKNEGRNRVVLAHRGDEEPARESSVA